MDINGKIDNYLMNEKVGGLGVVKQTAIKLFVKAIVKGGREKGASNDEIRELLTDTFFRNPNDKKRKEARPWIESVLDKELGK